MSGRTLVYCPQSHFCIAFREQANDKGENLEAFPCTQHSELSDCCFTLHYTGGGAEGKPAAVDSAGCLAVQAASSQLKQRSWTEARA